jgi:hypothetical protein
MWNPRWTVSGTPDILANNAIWWGMGHGFDLALSGPPNEMEESVERAAAWKAISTPSIRGWPPHQRRRNARRLKHIPTPGDGEWAFGHPPDIDIWIWPPPNGDIPQRRIGGRQLEELERRPGGEVGTDPSGVGRAGRMSMV